MTNGLSHFGNNGINGYSGLGFGSILSSLGLGSNGTDYIGGCSTPGAIAGTIGGMFVGEKVADFVGKQTKLPNWGPVAIKFGTAVALGMWASKKGIL